MKADLILVLEKGRIVAQGRHAELLESSETYAEIYNSQLLSDVEPAGEIEPAATTAPGE
jgi:ATP-binding cassette subfamily B protein